MSAFGELAGFALYSAIHAGRDLLFAAAISVAIELLFAGKEHQTLSSRLRGLGFHLVYLCIGISLVATVRFALDWYSIKPVFDVDLRWTLNSDNLVVVLLAYTVLPLAGLFVFDFFYYWFHRLQHAVPILWRFHSIHHSIREMNAINNYHHITEDLLRLPLVAVPSVLIFHVSAPDVIVQLIFIRIFGVLSHANSSVQYGVLKYLILEPRYHRIHHSMETRHWNRNFSAVFPVIDLMFGTAHFPDKDEYPRTGLPDQDEPRSLSTYLFPKRSVILGERAHAQEASSVP